MRIGDLIAVPPVQTVIRLEDGRTQPEAIARSFVFTPEVAAHVEVLCAALQKDCGQGYFLHGDFGSGKSHFLSALSALLDRTPGTAILGERHPGLQALLHSGRRYLAVPVSLVQYRASSPLEQILVQNLEAALARHGTRVPLSPLAVFLGHLRDLLTDAGLAAQFAARVPLAPEALPMWLESNPRDAYTHGIAFLREHGLPEPECLVEDRHETFGRALAAVKAKGFTGTLFLIDELSEFLRAKPDARRLNEDARTLQFLGELAGTQPLWLLAAVQESIERTGDIAQVTCRKIKDRFPITFTLGTPHIRELIASRLITRQPGADTAIRGLYDAFRTHFPSFTCPFPQFLAAYPVHPATLALLEGLSDLFSQHRGIVDFVYSQIAGDPQRHIPGILARPATELLTPDSLYEHFTPRLMEYSAFHVFPRHIVPHLDEVIERVLNDPGDRVLARRLVRILVLHRIHPTASTPTVGELAPLTGCLLAAQDPELNAQFVAEAILEPVAAGSRFLVRRAAPTGTRASAWVYELATEQDPAKTLDTRLRAVMDGIPADDSRLLTATLGELPESTAWPGPELLAGPLMRLVPWRGSQRRCLIRLWQAGGAVTAAVPAPETEVDFTLVLSLGTPPPPMPHTAVWQVPPPADPEQLLRENLALYLLLAALQSGNPADAPLLDPARERRHRVAAAAAHVALQALYGGRFVTPAVTVESAALQLRRFERLLEAAAETLLEQRYPRYATIAPRTLTPSPRLYQRLLDSFVAPGSLSLHAARQQGLVEIMDNLATPLGLVELRSGSYAFQPDTQRHPLLTHLLGLLRPAAPTPLPQLREALCRGEFGLPPETLDFLLAALAHAGVVALHSQARIIPLDFLHLAAAGGLAADAVSLGELIPETQRALLVTECAFLAPQGADWTQSFGLKQQREAWQSLCRFRDKQLEQLRTVRARLAAVAEYSAFQPLGLPRQYQRVQTLQDLLADTQTSLPAREGLEHFLAAWRGSGLAADDVAGVQALAHFFAQHADAFIFMDHYLRHRAVAQAAADSPDLQRLHRSALERLLDPRLLDDETRPPQLATAFQAFRDAYARAYAEAHQRHQHPPEPDLGRQGRRVLELLQRLATIPELDKPTGLDALLQQLTAAGRNRCERQVAELLRRTPVCDCGFDMHAAALEPAPVPVEPCSLLDSALTAYAHTLGQPHFVAALQARAVALQDAAPTTAVRLERLLTRLTQPADQLTGGRLPDCLDPETLNDVAQALRGNVPMATRRLDDFARQLQGRRLQPAQVQAAFANWLGTVASGSLIAVDGDAAASASAPTPAWWPLTRPELSDLHPRAIESGRVLASLLETHFPAASLRHCLLPMANADLARLLAGEPFHLQFLREAWLLLADRVLSVQGERLPAAAGTAGQADPVLRSAMTDRLTNLQRLQADLAQPLPARLGARLHLAGLWLDAWASDRLQGATDQALADLERRGHDWLTVLPPVPVLDLAAQPLVLLLDAVPPDVWLAALAAAPDLAAGATLTWHRLTTAPETRAAISHLFGFPDTDPLAACAARGIPCHRLAGNEAAALPELLPPLPADRPALIHIAAFDRGAHGARLRLPDMPALLVDLLCRRLPQLRRLPGATGRPLVVTTDHGVSFRRGQLSHGGTGVFELAVPRLLWPRDSG